MSKRVNITGKLWDSMDCTIVPHEIIRCPLLSEAAKTLYMLLTGTATLDTADLALCCAKEDRHRIDSALHELIDVGLLLVNSDNTFLLHTSIPKTIPYADHKGWPCAWHEGKTFRMSHVPKARLIGVQKCVYTAEDGTQHILEADYGQE